jgi:hypothetical protein
MSLRLLLILQCVMSFLIRFCHLTIISTWTNVNIILVFLLRRSVTSCLALNLDVFQIYATIVIGDL